MWKWIVPTLLIASSVLAPTVLAQKIGYVSSDAIRAVLEPNKQAEERLNSYVDEWKAEMAQRQTDIEELELEFKKNRLIWSDSERQTKEKEVAEKRNERDQYARMKFEPGGEHDQQAESLFKPVWNKIYLAVQKVSVTEGYDIVWDKSVQPLVYVNAKYDITVKVMKELGIDAEELERKQKEVVDSDPRNRRVDEARKRKSRRSAADSTLTPTPVAQDPNLVPSSSPIPYGTMPPGLPLVPSPADTTKKDDVPR